MSDIDLSAVTSTGIIPEGLELVRTCGNFEIKNVRNVISENKGKKVSRMRLTGIIQKCDEINENGRIYGADVIREAVEAIQPSLKSRKCMGEFDHPNDAKIHIDRVSHVMTKVWMEGKYVYGELEVLDKMPYGQMLKSLVESDIPVGISSRGVGDLAPTVVEGVDEAYEVLDGFRFVTWDVVAEPSVKEAELKIMESKQRLFLKKARNLEQELLKELSIRF
jgi:hypothetical protein